jgi:O-methyltransferase
VTKEFEAFYEMIKAETIVPAEHCWHLFEAVRRSSGLEGQMAEVGVYRGGSAYLMSKACPEKQLHIFDTFSGMHNADANVDFHTNGEFSDVVLEEVQSFLKPCKNVRIHAGLFPDSIPDELRQMRFAIVHFDGDLYRSMLDSLDFFWPRMSLGAVMVVHDYHTKSCPGVKKAVSKFFNRLLPVMTSSGQALLIKAEE